MQGNTIRKYISKFKIRMQMDKNSFFLKKINNKLTTKTEFKTY